MLTLINLSIFLLCSLCTLAEVGKDVNFCFIHAEALANSVTPNTTCEATVLDFSPKLNRKKTLLNWCPKLCQSCFSQENNTSLLQFLMSVLDYKQCHICHLYAEDPVLWNAM